MLTIRRRGKYFHIRGSIRLGKETRVIKEHSCGTARREDAEAYRAKLEAEIRHEILYGRGGRTHTLTIADAGLSYIARPGGMSRADLWRLEKINAIVGDKKISQSVEAWTEFKRIQCARSLPSSVARWRATYAAAINYLAAEEGFDAPRLPRGAKVSSKRIRYLTEAQADRLIASYAPHVKPIALMLRWQGLRIGEALRVDWQHLNWQASSIFVPETKNGEPRTVTMHRETRKALHRLWIERGSPGEGPLFLTHRGQPYRDPRNYKLPGGSPIKRAHATACRRAGIVDFHVHDWRHHWASHCVMAGIDLETIRQEGGWKSLRMVERYAAVSSAHRISAMARLK
jgi:integrase